jgi:hypothetical protein
MKLYFDIRIALVAAGCLVASPMRAQPQPPGRPFILKAADNINVLTPIGLPTQTILIGSVNGSTGEFSWALEESYPPNVPDYKRAETGGPMQPDHVAHITSLNVIYEFNVQNPSGVRIVLLLPDANGAVQERPATLQGTKARIAFRPLSFREQSVRISAGGKTTMIRVKPELAEQLGAFVVPHLLLNILYEPPGERSVAIYEQTQTIGSSISWGFSRGSRYVETVDPEKLNNLFISAMSGAVGLASKPAGKAIEIIAGLREQHQVTTTTDTTASSFGSEGTFFSLTQGFSTGVHQYPGRGDRFLIMYDVLFVYFAKDNRISVAPVAFSAVRGLTLADMKNELPPAVVNEFLALDPHFASTGSATGMLVGGVSTPGRFERKPAATSPRLPASRFAMYATLACDTTGANWIRLEEGTTQTTGQSRTISKTIVDKVTGLAATLSGQSESYLMLSYTTSSAQTQTTSNSASVSTHCGASEGAYEVKVYFDNVLRTFFTLKGAPYGGQSYIAGTVTNEAGEPQPGQPVTLRIGSTRYAVVSGRDGSFTFNFAGMPRGAGRLTAARGSTPVTLGGAPVRGVRVVAVGAGQATTQPSKRVGRRDPAASRPPVVRPRRP